VGWAFLLPPLNGWEGGSSRVLNVITQFLTPHFKGLNERKIMVKITDIYLNLVNNSGHAGFQKKNPRWLPLFILLR